jgi:XTP/dITP diphosphohydrolase
VTPTVVLATHNQGKVAELRRILEAAQLDVRLVSAREVDLPEPEETGTTFAENALLKARAAAQASQLIALADDSGLVVDALNGEPGVRSARYAGAHGDDDANLALVLERMAGRSDRSARFVCVAALVTPSGVEDTVDGVVEGVLTEQPRGSNGFGYDPIFVPTGFWKTTAEMTPAQKDRISHRGKAFRAIAERLAQSLPPRSTS